MLRNKYKTRNTISTNAKNLAVSFKILERFISARVEPIIDPLVPRERAWFRRKRLTVDQVTLLTQKIDDSFLAKKKAESERNVFVDFTSAHDIVGHRRLTVFFKTGTRSH